jgi:SAM-dependent methyltransferase
VTPGPSASDLRRLLRQPRRASTSDGRPVPARTRRVFPPGDHEQAKLMYETVLRAHPHLEDRDSRLCELVEYFGYETGAKAQYCLPWFYWDDPRRPAYLEKLGLDEFTFGMLHMYALFNRLDPARPDLYYIYDGLLARLTQLGGPDQVSVLDFGCGLGQNGLAFTAAGYRTLMIDVVDMYLDFVAFLARNRGLEPELLQASSEDEFYDTGADGHAYGVVIEWSTFEHVGGVRQALERVLRGLVPGGMFVTTTFCRDWTPEDIEHYKRDTQDDELASEYLSGEVDAWLRESFEVLSPARTLAKVLVKR